MESSSKFNSLLTSPRLPWIAGLIALVLTLPSLTTGFMADDFVQRAVMLQPDGLEGSFGSTIHDLFTFANGDPKRMEQLIDRGMYPWMTTHDLKLSFWRPLTGLTHWLDYQLWPNSALMMHLHNLLWFVVMVILAGYFYRETMGVTLTAGLACLLFAIDDAHAWPAAWIANRNAPVAMTLCLLALIAHHRWRDRGLPWLAIVSVGIYTAALFAKESSIATCGYLFAYALYLDKGTLPRRLMTLAPYAVATIGWRLCYIQVNGSATGSEAYIDPLLSPIQFITAAATRIPILLQCQWVYLPADVLLLAPPEMKTAITILARITLIALALILYPLVKQNRTARFWCLGMLLAIIPFAAVSPQDRVLLFPGLGAMGLLAQLLVSLKSGAYSTLGGIIPTILLKPIRLAFVTIHLVIAPIMLPLSIVGLGFMMGLITRLATEELPIDDSIAEETFILVNGSNYPIGTYVYIIRSLEGLPMPERIRSLAPPTMAAIPTEITRIDDNSITVRPDGGYPWSLFRSYDNSFAIGDTIELSDMTIHIDELAKDGSPTIVTYTFHKSLDDPTLRWFRLNGLNYETMPPPEIGKTLRLLPIESS